MDIFRPFQIIADLATYNLFGLKEGAYLGSAVNFFIYDLLKIGLLLLLINYVMAATRYYFPMEKARDLLATKRLFGVDYLLAALLGVVTPFCSCSSIPLFMGFVGAGIPLGLTFTFLISSPLVNEASLYLFPALFGIKVTLLYNGIGMLVSILGGMLIQRLHMEKYIKPELRSFKSRRHDEINNNDEKPALANLLSSFWTEGLAITKTIFPYVVLGVGIGALIHGFVPASFTEHYLMNGSWWTVPAAVIAGAPLYANSVSVIPIMEALVGKGVPIGTALAFMTAIVTVSIPESLILKKVMGWQLLALFFAITITGIILMGYVLNFAIAY